MYLIIFFLGRNVNREYPVFTIIEKYLYVHNFHLRWFGSSPRCNIQKHSSTGNHCKSIFHGSMLTEEMHQKLQQRLDLSSESWLDSRMSLSKGLNNSRHYHLGHYSRLHLTARCSLQKLSGTRTFRPKYFKHILCFWNGTTWRFRNLRLIYSGSRRLRPSSWPLLRTSKMWCTSCRSLHFFFKFHLCFQPFLPLLGIFIKKLRALLCNSGSKVRAQRHLAMDAGGNLLMFLC